MDTDQTGSRTDDGSAIVSGDSVRQIGEEVRLDGSYLVLMSVSGILSAVALLTNSVPVLIGSMVVAPALPPFGLIAFALVAGRIGEAARGLGIGLAGLGIAIVGAIATTWLMNVTGVLPEDVNLLDKGLLEERVRPGWYSVVAALAAGVAGMLALAQRKTDTIVGVVAALALVPAVGAAGIAFLSDDPVRAFGGFALLAINVACLVASGVVTLVILGLGKKARRKSKSARI